MPEFDCSEACEYAERETVILLLSRQSFTQT